MPSPKGGDERGEEGVRRGEAERGEGSVTRATDPKSESVVPPYLFVGASDFPEKWPPLFGSMR
jgi:hypothetical protein